MLARRPKVKRLNIPKSASGMDIRDMLLAKQKKQGEEKAAKEIKKKEREQNKTRREEEKQIKRLQREKNRKEKQEKRMKEQERKRTLKNLKAIMSKLRYQADSDEDMSESDIPYAEDEDVCMEEDGNIDICGVCLVPESEGDEDQWMGCTGCDRWFHQQCVGYEGLTQEQLEQIPFLCTECI